MSDDQIMALAAALPEEAAEALRLFLLVARDVYPQPDEYERYLRGSTWEAVLAWKETRVSQ